MTRTKEHLLELSAQKWRWMSSRDVNALDQLFATNAVFVHMGATLERDEELDVIGTGRIHYRDFDITDSSARMAAEGVGIVLTTMTLGSVVNGTEVSNPFVTTEVFVADDQTWRLASLSFTRLAT